MNIDLEKVDKYFVIKRLANFVERRKAQEFVPEGEIIRDNVHGFLRSFKVFYDLSRDILVTELWICDENGYWKAR